jgi:hypothetical protein
MASVLPHDAAEDSKFVDEFTGRRAFDSWRFAQPERLIPWDWADMGTVEQRQWIERGKKRGAA